ncbi:unnamed protein product [Prorocentrum cordatum]|uniref:Uncharacterized protein n=1 Tax=Prorocentrum cordatum TaxID=2364126 RepID=A0ABN9X5V0_9DINO|nr:unnamed protein product [Polarella glacialis]
MAAPGDWLLIRYEVPGPEIFHERVVTGVSETEPSLAANYTNDGDHYAEDASQQNDDIAEVRWIARPGDTPAGVDPRRVYGFPPDAALMEQLKRDGALMVGGRVGQAAAGAPGAGAGAARGPGIAGAVGRAGAAAPPDYHGYTRGQQLPDPLPDGSTIVGDCAVVELPAGKIVARLVARRDLDSYVVDDLRVMHVKFNGAGVRRRPFAEAVDNQDEVAIQKEKRKAKEEAKLRKSGKHPPGGATHEARGFGVRPPQVKAAPRANTMYTRREAARELLAINLSYTGEEAKSPVVRYDRSRVDIPRVGSSVPRVEAVIDPVGREYLLHFEARMLRSADEWGRIVETEPPITPYMDEYLRKHDDAYVTFVGDLVSAGMVSFTFNPKDLVTPFFVSKKNGQQRLVRGARIPNRVCLQDDVDETGSFKETLYCAQADIRNYFYALGLREELGLFFSLPPVPEAMLSQWGCSAVDSPQVERGGWVWPFLSVVPMGWNWAFWLGQRCNVFRCLQAASVGPERLLTDHGPVPSLGAGRPRLLPYCDNINVVGTDPHQCDNMLDDIISSWTSFGVEIHEVVRASSTFSSLGRLVDGVQGMVFSRPERTDRFRQACLWLERRPRVTGKEIERFVGHVIDHIMLRRELLCILRALYDFIREHYAERRRLWPSAAAEVAQCRSLLSVMFSNLRMPWSPIVVASDACLSGMAAATTNLPVSVVSSIGRVSERWRYRVPTAVSARKSALASSFGEGSNEGADGDPCEAIFGEGSNEDTYGDPREAIVREGSEGPRGYVNMDVFGDVNAVKSVEYPLGSEDPWELNPDFAEVPHSVLSEEAWTEVFAAPFHVSESITVLEGRASNAASRHILGSTRAFNKRHLKLGDNLGTVLALSRGRCSAFGLLLCCRREAAYSVAANVRFENRWIPSELNHSDKGSRRRAAATGTFQLVPAGSQSFLETNAVAPDTQKTYAECMVELRQFVAVNGLSLDTPAAADLALTNYANFAWAEGLDKGAVQRVYAAFVSEHPDFSRRGGLRLPRLSRALQGWERLDPGVTRPPIPWVVTALIAQVMITTLKQPAAALMVLAMFLAYLRPSEAEGLLEQDLVPPTTSSPFFAVNLHPSDRGEVSKVRLSDESLLLDSTEALWLGGALQSLKAGLPSRPLFDLTALQLRDVWAAALRALGIPNRFVLCQLRHGGPSHDRLRRQRSLPEIKERGRWASDKSVRRYEAHALVQQQEASLPPALLRRAREAPGKLEGLVLTSLGLRGRRRRPAGIPPFAELTCGSAHLAAAVGECGLAAEGWDYIDGAAADLEVPAVIEGFRQRIRQRRLCGLHFGLDCKTWSRARKNDGLGPPPLRSDQHIFCLPALAPADQRKIDSANVIFRNILSLVEEAVAANLFVLIENPASSRHWMTPQLLDLANAYKAKFHRVDYCQYNVPCVMDTEGEYQFRVLEVTKEEFQDVAIEYRDSLKVPSESAKVFGYWNLSKAKDRDRLRYLLFEPDAAAFALASFTMDGLEHLDAAGCLGGWEYVRPDGCMFGCQSPDEEPMAMQKPHIVVGNFTLKLLGAQCRRGVVKPLAGSSGADPCGPTAAAARPGPEAGNLIVGATRPLDGPRLPCEPGRTEAPTTGATRSVNKLSEAEMAERKARWEPAAAAAKARWAELAKKGDWDLVLEAVGLAGECPGYKHLGSEELQALEEMISLQAEAFWVKGSARTVLRGFEPDVATTGLPARGPPIRLKGPEATIVREGLEAGVEQGLCSRGASPWGSWAFPTKGHASGRRRRTVAGYRMVNRTMVMFVYFSRRCRDVKGELVGCAFISGVGGVLQLGPAAGPFDFQFCTDELFTGTGRGRYGSVWKKYIDDFWAKTGQWLGGRAYTDRKHEEMLAAAYPPAATSRPLGGSSAAAGFPATRKASQSYDHAKGMLVGLCVAQSVSGAAAVESGGIALANSIRMCLRASVRLTQDILEAAGDLVQSVSWDIGLVFHDVCEMVILVVRFAVVVQCCYFVYRNRLWLAGLTRLGRGLTAGEAAQRGLSPCAPACAAGDGPMPMSDPMARAAAVSGGPSGATSSGGGAASPVVAPWREAPFEAPASLKLDRLPAPRRGTSDADARGCGAEEGADRQRAARGRDLAAGGAVASARPVEAARGARPSVADKLCELEVEVTDSRGVRYDARLRARRLASATPPASRSCAGFVSGGGGPCKHVSAAWNCAVDGIFGELVELALTAGRREGVAGASPRRAALGSSDPLGPAGAARELQDSEAEVARLREEVQRLKEAESYVHVACFIFDQPGAVAHLEAARSRGLTARLAFSGRDKGPARLRAKALMTGREVVIGSCNFTAASLNNAECSAAVQQLSEEAMLEEKAWFEQLFEAAVRASPTASGRRCRPRRRAERSAAEGLAFLCCSLAGAERAALAAARRQRVRAFRRCRLAGAERAARAAVRRPMVRVSGAAGSPRPRGPRGPQLGNRELELPAQQARRGRQGRAGYRAANSYQGHFGFVYLTSSGQQRRSMVAPGAKPLRPLNGSMPWFPTEGSTATSAAGSRGIVAEEPTQPAQRAEPARDATEEAGRPPQPEQGRPEEGRRAAAFPTLDGCLEELPEPPGAELADLEFVWLLQARLAEPPEVSPQGQAPRARSWAPAPATGVPDVRCSTWAAPAPALRSAGEVREPAEAEPEAPALPGPPGPTPPEAEPRPPAAAPGAASPRDVAGGRGGADPVAEFLASLPERPRAELPTLEVEDQRDQEPADRRASEVLDGGSAEAADEAGEDSRRGPSAPVSPIFPAAQPAEPASEGPTPTPLPSPLLGAIAKAKPTLVQPAEPVAEVAPSGRDSACAAVPGRQERSWSCGANTKAIKEKFSGPAKEPLPAGGKPTVRLRGFHEIMQERRQRSQAGSQARDIVIVT